MTSYFYNFMMWLSIVWVFHWMHPVLGGNMVVRSLKVFGIMLLFFASLAAVLMNHYQARQFHALIILDGVIVFPIIGVLNGLLYPLIVRPAPARDR